MEFKCSNCEKTYGTYTYFNCGSFINQSGQLQTYQAEMYKCVCPYCNHANTDQPADSK